MQTKSGFSVGKLHPDIQWSSVLHRVVEGFLRDAKNDDLLLGRQDAFDSCYGKRRFTPTDLPDVIEFEAQRFRKLGTQHIVGVQGFGEAAQVFQRLDHQAAGRPYFLPRLFLFPDIDLGQIDLDQRKDLPDVVVEFL